MKRFDVRPWWLACFVVLGASAPSAGAQSRSSRPPHPGMVRIAAGRMRPFYPARGQETVRVAAFWLDEHAVTNADFLAFVVAHPDWQRSHVARLFADERYLAHWASDTSLGSARPSAPVTFVSWFAAKAFCESDGRRLPREIEWEYAARASETAIDGSRDPAMRARILAWYSRPQPDQVPDVRSTVRNAWGVWDMHGLVWEWVEDWNAPRDVSDSRNPETASEGRVCGAASVGASDRSDYAAFMRYAFRSSLRGDHTIGHLGFRCASDA